MKKCIKCGGKVERPGIEYCEECCYDAMGEEIEKHPIGGHRRVAVLPESGLHYDGETLSAGPKQKRC